MAIKKCRYCGEKVSATFKTCPFCEKPLRGRTITDYSGRVSPLTGLLILLFCAAALLYAFMYIVGWEEEIRRLPQTLGPDLKLLWRDLVEYVKNLQR